MGNQFLCPELDPEAKKLFFMLEMASKSTVNPNKFSNMLIDYRSDLEHMIRQGKKVEKKFGGVIVEVIPYSRFSFEATQSQKSWKPVKLILRTEMEKPEIGHEQTNPSHQGGEIISEGCIIFSSAYYCGQILNGKAHGMGTLHYDCLQLYEVEGLWRNDSLQFGQVYRMNKQETGAIRQKSFEIDLFNGERNASIKVEKPNESFQYRGSIKLQGSTNLNEILTGVGTIKYSNGDEYHGELLNGLYDTHPGTHGQIIYADKEYKTFKGCFKQGLREDRGIFRMQIGGKMCDLNINFVKGVPQGDGFLNFDDKITTYSIQVKDQRIQAGHRQSEVHHQP